MLKKTKTYLLAIAFLFVIPAPLAVVSSSAQVSAQAAAQIEKGVKQAGGDKNTTSLPAFIRTIVDILLFLIGSIAVITIIISGIRFVTASGNADQVKSARDGIIYSVVGIVVAIMAYAIVRFITSNLK